MNSLKIMSWNARGLDSQLEELINFVELNDPYVICIQETLRNKSTKISYIPNYTGYFTDRADVRGGGTAIYVKNKAEHHQVIIDCTHIENAAISIKVPDNFITIISISVPPSNRNFDLDLPSLINGKQPVVLIGDLN